MNATGLTNRRSFLRLLAAVPAASLIRPASIVSAATDRNVPGLPDLGEALRIPLVDPKMVISKSKRTLHLYSAKKLIKTYRVALGLSPVEE